MRPVVVLAGSEVPTGLLGRADLGRRAYLRESVPEYRFALADPRPKVPIRRYGTVQLARWGNTRGRSRALPRAALTRKDRVEAGDWSRFGAVPVEVAATFWCAGGAWVFVREGSRACWCPSRRGWRCALSSASRRRTTSAT